MKSANVKLFQNANLIKYFYFYFYRVHEHKFAGRASSGMRFIKSNLKQKNNYLLNTNLFSEFLHIKNIR